MLLLLRRRVPEPAKRLERRHRHVMRTLLRLLVVVWVVQEVGSWLVRLQSRRIHLLVVHRAAVPPVWWARPRRDRHVERRA